MKNIIKKALIVSVFVMVIGLFWTGEIFAKPKYDDIFSFSEGMAIVEVDHKYGYIDKTGKEVVKPKYDEANPFNEGLALVGIKGKYGFVDKNGKAKIWSGGRF